MTFEIKRITDLINCQKPFTYSFEVTPDIKESEFEKLTIEPTFFSITWHASKHLCKDLNIAPLKVAKYLKSKKKHVLLHVTCERMKKDYLKHLLDYLKSEGFCNLFILLGESYDRSHSDFESSMDLIKAIREQQGNYFCIGIAGYPECNEEALKSLKSKMDAGAEFIITQAFFDAHIYTDYGNRCKKFGINALIIPGMFCFETEKELHGFIKFCNVKVSSNFTKHVADETAKHKSGVDVMSHVINEVKKDCNHVHIFTLNKLHTASALAKQIQ